MDYILNGCTWIYIFFHNVLLYFLNILDDIMKYMDIILDMIQKKITDWILLIFHKNISKKIVIESSANQEEEDTSNLSERSKRKQYVKRFWSWRIWIF